MTRKSIEVPGFTLPGIEDITRRDFLIGGAVALLLAGCGSGETESEFSGDTRTVESPMGSVEFPENPERLVAMYGFCRVLGETDHPSRHALGHSSFRPPASSPGATRNRPSRILVASGV
jgi:hypothetical protein